MMNTNKATLKTLLAATICCTVMLGFNTTVFAAVSSDLSSEVASEATTAAEQEASAISAETGLNADGSINHSPNTGIAGAVAGPIAAIAMMAGAVPVILKTRKKK